MVNALTDAPSETNEKRVTQSGEIVFEGVSKSFTAESVPAVDGISFRVAAGVFGCLAWSIWLRQDNPVENGQPPL